MLIRSQIALHRAVKKLLPLSECSLLIAPYLMITLYSSLQMEAVEMSLRATISVYLVNMHLIQKTHLFPLFVFDSSPLRSIDTSLMDLSIIVTWFEMFFSSQIGFVFHACFACSYVSCYVLSDGVPVESLFNSVNGLLHSMMTCFMVIMMRYNHFCT